MITGSMMVHLPLAPSKRMSMVEMKIPKKRTPLKPLSTPPIPYAGSCPNIPVKPLSISENPASPPVTYPVEKNMKLTE